MSAVFPLGARRVLRLHFTQPAWVLLFPAGMAVAALSLAVWLHFPELSTWAAIGLVPFWGMVFRRFLPLAVAFGTRRRDYWLAMSLATVASGLVAALAATAVLRALDGGSAVGGGPWPVIFVKVLALVLVGLFGGNW